jgi:L-ascorbate metabolism protein UlaG (beta-lactamase superfamily)
MEIIYYGHSCFEVQYNEHRILFDPFIRPNPKAASIALSSINPTLIAISHAHGDHIADAESIAKQCGAPILANYEITSWFTEKGVEQTIGMNTGGTYRLPNLSISITQALHSSSFPDGDMHLIGQHYNPEFAFLPIGDHFTMGYERAAEASKLLNVKSVIGMHFDTFPPIEIDHEQVQQHFNREGIRLIIPEIGKTITM